MLLQKKTIEKYPILSKAKYKQNILDINEMSIYDLFLQN